MFRIRKIRVFALAVPVALAVVTGTALADPLLAEAIGLDVWHVGELERSLRNSKHVENRLERELQMIIDRANVHSLLLDDLVAGRVSLRDAARQKWEMNRHRSIIIEHLDTHRCGPNYEAKMAHDLISLASGIASTPPGVRARLIAEYREAYGVEFREKY